MSQEEVLKILKKEGIATAEEISVMLEIGVAAVRENLRKMLDEDVEKIIIKKRYSRHCFAWKPINLKVPKYKLERYNEKEKIN